MTKSTLTPGDVVRIHRPKGEPSLVRYTLHSRNQDGTCTLVSPGAEVDVPAAWVVAARSDRK